MLILGAGVATGLIAARSLGATGRGELATITLWSSTLLSAGALGFPEAVAYFAAAEPAARARVWVLGQGGAVVLGTLVAVLGWWLLPLVFGTGDPQLAQMTRWYLLAFSVPCLGFACASGWLQGVGEMYAFNISRSSVHILNAAAMTLLAAAAIDSVAYFAAATLFGTTAGWLLSVFMGPLRGVRTAVPSAGLPRRMLHYGFRVQVGNWSNALSLRLDQLLLSLVATAASLGVYVVAVSYANILYAVPASAAMQMFPRFVRAHAAGSSRVHLEQWYRRVLWVTVPVAIGIGVCGLLIIPAAFGDDFAEAIPLLAVLVPATVVVGMSEIFSSAFSGIGRPDIDTRSEVLGLGVTVAALAALLPGYGIYGAAMASLLAYTARHAYLARQAVAVFGTDYRALFVPTRADLHALRAAGTHAGRSWLRYSPFS